MGIVLDSSMTIAWLFADERADAAHAKMRRVVSSGAVVPSLRRLEVANVLRNAVRRGRCDEAYVDRSLERLSRFPVEVDDETSMHAWTTTQAFSPQAGADTLRRRVSRAGHPQVPAARDMRCGAYGRRGPVRTSRSSPPERRQDGAQLNSPRTRPRRHSAPRDDGEGASLISR